jgi:hypothetical protein
MNNSLHLQQLNKRKRHKFEIHFCHRTNANILMKIAKGNELIR